MRDVENVLVANLMNLRNISRRTEKESAFDGVTMRYQKLRLEVERA